MEPLIDQIEQRRVEEAQKALNELLDSEVAYRFMSGASEFMSTEGLTVLKAQAKLGRRWALRLLVDAMKIMAKMEMVKAASTGRTKGRAVRITTGFAKDGEKI